MLTGFSRIDFHLGLRDVYQNRLLGSCVCVGYPLQLTA